MIIDHRTSAQRAVSGLRSGVGGRDLGSAPETAHSANGVPAAPVRDGETPPRTPNTGSSDDLSHAAVGSALDIDRAKRLVDISFVSGPIDNFMTRMPASGADRRTHATATETGLRGP